MPKNLLITGSSDQDTKARHEALMALQSHATTEELVKLQQLLNDPSKRELLKYA